MKTAGIIKAEQVSVDKNKSFFKGLTKARYLFIAFFSLLLLNILLSSCDDDGYSLNDLYGDYGVVNKEGNSYTINTDLGAVLFPSASNVSPDYLKDKDRVIVTFSILGDADTSSMYDYYVKVVDVYKILTKDVIPFSASISDSLGNDPIILDKAWIRHNYLTLDFVFGGGLPGLKHMVNLAQHPQKTEDGRILLEFRHNAFRDVSNYAYRGVVAFPVSSIQTEAQDSVQLRIKYRENGRNKQYDLTWYKDEPQNSGDKLYSITGKRYQSESLK